MMVAEWQVQEILFFTCLQAHSTSEYSYFFMTESFLEFCLPIWV